MNDPQAEATNDMTAFDRLTPRLRARLRNGARNLSAVLALNYQQRQIDEHKIIASINHAESQMIAASNRDRGV